MLLKNYSRGVPFLGNRFMVDRSKFLEQGKQVYITSWFNHSASGHNSHFNINNVMKSAIGEWIERNSLLMNNAKKKRSIPAFNMLNGQVVEVENDKIFFIEDGNFNDSCGVASHLTSDKAIFAAFMEFFERQSLVFSWLTKQPGKIIAINDVKDARIHALYSKLYQFVDEVYMIDISLHPNIHVIFGLGIGEYYKTVGLSANWSLNAAIENAMEEMFQTFANSWTKANLHEKDFRKNNIKNIDIYLEYYHSMTPDKFKQEYDFLWKNERKENEKHSDKKFNELSFNEKIKIVCEDLKIIPYCCFIPCYYDHFKTKIVKVISFNGYPHMNPKLFSDEQTRITFNKNIVEFPNAFRPLPFP